MVGASRALDLLPAALDEGTSLSRVKIKLEQRRAPSPAVKRPGRFSMLAAVGLLCLLAAPSFALSRLASRVDWRLLLAAPILVSLFTFVAYRIDKRRAQAGDWRIPESTLHLAELIGGWPGAFLAQRTLRHKISKASYQFEFWIIVFVHQIVAIDSLVDWRFTKLVLRLIQSHSA